MRVSTKRPSPATVLASLALFVALGGSGYAASNLSRVDAGASQLHKSAGASPPELVPTALPRGLTLRGVYFVGSSSAAGNQLATSQISFPIELARPPVAHFVRLEAVAPAACSGTAARPTAARGHLCVYEARQSQAGEHRILDPVSGKAGGLVRVWGAALSVRATSGGDVFSGGTWAVTAR
jgi:hypothetical protein